MQKLMEWPAFLQLGQMFVCGGWYAGRAMVGKVREDCVLEGLVRKGMWDGAKLRNTS